MSRLGAMAPIVAAIALMPGASRGDEEHPVLHKHVVIDTAAGLPPGMNVIPGGEGPADLPRGIVAAGEVLPAPSLQRPPGPAAAPGRNAGERLDGDTRAEGTLHYEEIFNPATAPYKRLSAFDEVGAGPDYELRVASSEMVPVPVLGARDTPGRERFWGSVSLVLEPGERAELPSVAAGMRVLSYKTEPPVELEFLRDGADNYAVAAPALGERTAVRLVYLVDAPSFYFRGVAADGATLADVPDSLRPEVTPRLKDAVRERVAPRLGVSMAPTAGVGDTVAALVEYFRGFTATEGTDAAPAAAARGGADLYLELTLAKHGVCRHRAYAFVVTAHALGLPARYVANEAHAFVEVYLPAPAGAGAGADGDAEGGAAPAAGTGRATEWGWRRVDLGGAAAGLDVDGARASAVHDPGPDPFPQPDAYGRAYSRLAGLAPTDPAARAGFGGVRGLRDAGAAGAGAGAGAGAAAGAGAGAGAGADGGASASARGAMSIPTGSEWDPDVPPADVLGPGIPSGGDESSGGEPGAPGGPPGPRDDRLKTHLVITAADRAVLRGDVMHVRGVLVDVDGHPLRGVSVGLYLVRGGFGVTVGSADTTDDGTFSTDVVVPAAMEVGTYELRARFGGDRLFAPAVAE
jgi:transglutaminase-like putative cysteine protease